MYILFNIFGIDQCKTKLVNATKPCLWCCNYGPNLMSFIQNILLPRYAGLPICKTLNIMKIWKDMGAIILSAMIECNNLSISINVIPNIIGIR